VTVSVSAVVGDAFGELESVTLTSTGETVLPMSTRISPHRGIPHSRWCCATTG